MLLPSSSVADKGRQLWWLVETVPAFVLPDICYMSPAASWRLWLTARRNNVSPSRPTFFSLLRSFLTQEVAGVWGCRGGWGGGGVCLDGGGWGGLGGPP